MDDDQIDKADIEIPESIEDIPDTGVADIDTRAEGNGKKRDVSGIGEGEVTDNREHTDTTDPGVTENTDKTEANEINDAGDPISNNRGSETHRDPMVLEHSTIKQQAGLHILGVSELHKRFGRKEVVRGVTFFMHNGEVAGLLGPNGAGKTTIFYMIVGFYRPSAGKVTMDEENITAKPMYQRARRGIAYLPQEASIFRKLTVEQNVWAILESRWDIRKPEKKQRLESLLEEFGIARLRRQYGFTLSGGERRRTEIARALATEPKFLLLDEPFAGIDPIAVYEIKQIIRRLAQKGIGILITDHNVRDTLEITTEAFIINMGTIVARGDRDTILGNKMVRDVYLGSEFRM